MCQQCENENHGVKVGFPTVRRFGVELEGYVWSDIYGSYRTGNHIWDIGEDGSLDDGGNCDRCDGSGEVYCRTCDGNGSVDCCICLGNGNFDCSECEGNGYVWDEEQQDDVRCEECYGRGTIPCDECDGRGNIECDDCGGCGDVSCPDCDGDGNNGIYGIEARSEPLKHTAPIHRMYEYLHRHEWEVNNTAGLHIHVEAEDYGREDFQKILALMIGIEPVIYSMNDRYRYYYTSYCRPITNWHTNVISKLSCSHHVLWNHKFANTRYVGLNFDAHDEHGTIEFRYFSPQENSDKVEKFVELATKIVDFAKAATMEQILVIVKHLIQNKNNFQALAEIIQETLNLSFTPWNESSIYISYNWFRLEDIEAFEIGMGLVVPAPAADQAV
jgi:hypothetical protein